MGLLLGFVVSTAAVYAATPIAIRVAARLSFYDRPAGYKGHEQPTPYLGGLAVMIGFSFVLLVIAASGNPGETVPLLGGMSVLWAVGTMDDRFSLSPWFRMAVEVGLAAFLWAVGLGWDIGLGGLVDLLLTVLWIVAVVNALNLFDNMDGAATSMTFAVSACVVALGLVDGNDWLALTAAVLCGACLGFLPHNLASPSRIFLGDGGSMPLGFAIATLVMVGSANAAPAWQSLVLGLLLVGVPATDTCLVILSRRRRGVGILTGGRDHLTHRTREWLQTARGVAIALGGIQALVSAIALFAIHGGGTAFVVIAVFYLIAVATSIAFLEARYEEGDDMTPTTTPKLARRRGARDLPLLTLTVGFGVAAGASAFSSGFYRPGQWIPIGLALLALATAAAIARPVRLSRPQLAGIAALTGLGMWALLSSIWAPSISQATTDGNRWLVLAAIFGTAVVLVRTERAAAGLAGGAALGVTFVASYVLVHLLGANPGEIFLAGRLNQPLGYVNAEGTLFLTGFWLWFGLTERRSPFISGLGLGMATLMAGLLLLSQSRGAALALLGSLVVVLSLPGNRLRRSFALLLSAAGVIAVGRPLLDIYSGPGVAATHHAAVALMLASFAIGAIWAIAHNIYRRAVRRHAGLTVRLRHVGIALLVAIATTATGLTISKAKKLEHYISDQWTTFIKLSEPTGTATADAPTTHLVSGAGNRYDYWRIAWQAFEDRPLLGVGAGNYDRPYFRARQTAEDVRQPHSVEMQVLSELGLVGGLLMAVALGSLIVGVVRVRRWPSTSVSGPLAVAAVGVLVTWLIHTSVDWIHLFPGVTAIALGMGALLLRPIPGHGDAEKAPAGRTHRLTPATAAAALASIAVLITAASLSREGLAEFFRDRASQALSSSPSDAIREANQSLRLDAETPRTYYIKAAAQSRFNDAQGAKKTLEHALEKEPDNFVTWTLLGDLDVRRGDFAGAQRSYTQALRLNPGDPSLKNLAHNPRRALGTGP